MLEAALSFLLFSIINLASKSLLTVFSVPFFVFIKMFFPGVILLKSSGLNNILNLLKKNLYAFSFIILVSTVFPLLLKNFLLQKIPVSVFSLVGSTDPIIAACCSRYFFNTKFVIREFLASILASISLLSLAFSFNASGLVFSGACFLNIFLLFLTVVVGKIGWVYTVLITKDSAATSSQVNGIIMFLSSMLFLPYFLLSNDKTNYVFGCMSFFHWFLLFIIFFATSCANLLYTYSLQKYSFSLVSILGCLVPIFTTIGGIYFFKESLNVCIWIAGGILILAILLIQLPYLINICSILRGLVFSKTNQTWKA